MRRHPRSRLEVEPLVLQFRAAKDVFAVGPADQQGESSGHACLFGRHTVTMVYVNC